MAAMSSSGGVSFSNKFGGSRLQRAEHEVVQIEGEQDDPRASVHFLQSRGRGQTVHRRIRRPSARRRNGVRPPCLGTSVPSFASPTTSRFVADCRIMADPALTSASSSTIRMRATPRPDPSPCPADRCSMGEHGVDLPAAIGRPSAQVPPTNATRSRSPIKPAPEPGSRLPAATRRRSATLNCIYPLPRQLPHRPPPRHALPVIASCTTRYTVRPKVSGNGGTSIATSTPHPGRPRRHQRLEVADARLRSQVHHPDRACPADRLVGRQHSSTPRKSSSASRRSYGSTGGCRPLSAPIPGLTPSPPACSAIRETSCASTSWIPRSGSCWSAWPAPTSVRVPPRLLAAICSELSRDRRVLQIGTQERPEQCAEHSRDHGGEVEDDGVADTPGSSRQPTRATAHTSARSRRRTATVSRASPSRAALPRPAGGRGQDRHRVLPPPPHCGGRDDVLGPPPAPTCSGRFSARNRPAG